MIGCQSAQIGNLVASVATLSGLRYAVNLEFSEIFGDIGLSNLSNL